MRRSPLYLNLDQEGEEEINLTPLIDVVFVVLIMFILVAPLVEIDRIQLAGVGERKKADMTSFDKEGSIKIFVYDDNTIWMNGTCLTLEELSAELKERHAMAPQELPQVFHDRKAYFETYQSVKNTLEAAGFDAVDVILKPG